MNCEISRFLSSSQCDPVPPFRIIFVVLSSSTELFFSQTIRGKGQVFLISILSWTIIFVSYNQKLARKSDKKHKNLQTPVFISSIQEKLCQFIFVFFPFKISNFISVMNQWKQFIDWHSYPYFQCHWLDVL